ncbi:choline dehydrogenase [Nevskia sp.]|uniref:GMC family oxidoreductase n=1 Tax=Nevskia sp. TaxID=1929292 RepID=UPI0025EA3541|nr:choline dehydrogenase [Nevskia sp.]
MSKQTTFDFVIAGGGSAGCVLANRLSTSGKWQVCLVEAGPADRSPFIHMPAGLIPVVRSKVLNWQFWTAPEPNCGNRPMFWPRGRTLGGSSSINAMCYIRGHAWDYDHWASLGNDGWSYKDVLPYFRRMEHFEAIDKVDDGRSFHGVDGPLNVAEPRYVNPLMHAFLAAGQQAGHALTDDFNGAQQEGVGLYHTMQKDGQRCSNARAYLTAAKGRDNLTIITDAHAARVLFEGKRAVGLRYVKGGRIHDIKARSEVILSAGAIGSPQLLLLSGVGPKAELARHAIPQVQELPGVGENLQDHLDIHITMREKTRHSISLRPLGLLKSAINLLRYLIGRRGELTSNFAQAGGFIKSDDTQTIPDLQWHLVPFVYAHHGQKLAPLFKHYAYTLMTCFLRPESRGRIRLRDADPKTPPLIEANYLATERDMDALVAGFRKAREVLNQPAMAKHAVDELEPGIKVQSDDEIRAYIRAKAETVYHPVGSCKMGRDAQAVVDHRLRVHGVERLRVVDASIMPTLIGGNTNAPTTMIAERAADLILQDAALERSVPNYWPAEEPAEAFAGK